MQDVSKVYVGNLEYGLTEDEIKKAFEEKGITVRGAQIIKDKHSGRSKGFGFVELESEDAVQKAIEALDGQDLKGRNLKVSKAKKPTGGFNRDRA